MIDKRTFERDQAPSPFTPVLDELCRATGSSCAALVDNEGETVDYAGRGDPFEIRVLAAELRLLLQHAEQTGQLPGTYELTVRARRASFLVRSLPEGYALVVRLARRATGISDRCLSIAIRGLCAEAGFTPPHSRRSEAPQGTEVGRLWRQVRVDVDDQRSRRPCRVEMEAGPTGVEVMGRVASGERREAGFRVRLESGEEGTLIRERFGRWYLEEDAWE